jgi:hypothetical protein
MAYPNGTPKVKDCIAYIESCGWKFKGQWWTSYYFENPSANLVHQEMRFTLRELREALLYGW